MRLISSCLIIRDYPGLYSTPPPILYYLYFEIIAEDGNSLTRLTRVVGV